jgi:hypothetical protein
MVRPSFFPVKQNCMRLVRSRIAPPRPSDRYRRGTILAARYADISFAATTGPMNIIAAIAE